jgi:hypothetical protein
MTNISFGIKVDYPMMLESAIKGYQPNDFCPEYKIIEDLFFFERNALQ